MNQIIQEEKSEKKENKVEAKVIEKKETKTKSNIIKDEQEQSNTQEKQEVKPKTQKKKIIIAVCVIIALILAMLSTIFAILNIKNNNIMSGITINNIDVSKHSKEDALAMLKNKMQEKSEFIIVCEGKEYIILKENLNIDYDFEGAIEEAYNQGRNSNIFANNFHIAQNMFFGKNIQMDVKINDQSAQAEANKINQELPGGLEESSYSIEANKIIIKKGKAGRGISAEVLKEKIKESILQNSSEKIVIETNMNTPKEINIEKIRNEIYKEPKDAYYEKNPFTVHPHVDGVDIDIEAAKKLLEEDKEEYIIPLVITKPKITTDHIGSEAFPNLLGKCTTKYDTAKVSRTTNLQVAARTINNKVVLPGETFSYNRTLGERTYEKGYRLGGGFSGGRNVDMLGGGICQISSTLYNAVLIANLEIKERHNHAHIAAYLDPGKDATVSYGTLDFKFKNTRKNPIMIKAQVGGGYATVEIYGIKEDNEYDIEIISVVHNYIGYQTIYEDDPTKNVGYSAVIQQGMRGCNSTTYKVYKQNGKEVSREVLSKDHFAPMHKIIARGTKGAVAVEPEPVQPTPEPTVPEPTEPTTPQEPTTPEPTEPTNPEQPVEPPTPEPPTPPENNDPPETPNP